MVGLRRFPHDNAYDRVYLVVERKQSLHRGLYRSRSTEHTDIECNYEQLIHNNSGDTSEKEVSIRSPGGFDGDTYVELSSPVARRLSVARSPLFQV